MSSRPFCCGLFPSTLGKRMQRSNEELIRPDNEEAILMSDNEAGVKWWYYLDSGQTEGPVREKELTKLLESGSLAPDTLVCREGMTGWQKASEAFPPISLPLHHEPMTAKSGSKGPLNLVSWLCCLGGGAAGFLVAFDLVSSDDIFSVSAICFAAALTSAFSLGYVATEIQSKKPWTVGLPKQLAASIGQNIGQRTLTVLALVALLYVWKGEQDRLASAKRVWDLYSSMKWEKPYVPDYAPMIIKFFLVGCCYAGLMFVFKSPKRPSILPSSNTPEK